MTEPKTAAVRETLRAFAADDDDLPTEAPPPWEPHGMRMLGAAWNKVIEPWDRPFAVLTLIAPEDGYGHGWQIRARAETFAGFVRDHEAAAAALPAVVRLRQVRGQLAAARRSEGEAREKLGAIERDRAGLLAVPGEPDAAALHRLGVLEFEEQRTRRTAAAAATEAARLEAEVGPAFAAAQLAVRDLAERATGERVQALHAEREKVLRALAAAVPAELLNKLVAVQAAAVAISTLGGRAIPGLDKVLGPRPADAPELLSSQFTGVVGGRQPGELYPVGPAEPEVGRYVTRHETTVTHTGPGRRVEHTRSWDEPAPALADPDRPAPDPLMVETTETRPDGVEHYRLRYIDRDAPPARDEFEPVPFVADRTGQVDPFSGEVIGGTLPSPIPPGALIDRTEDLTDREEAILARDSRPADPAAADWQAITGG